MFLENSIISGVGSFTLAAFLVLSLTDGDSSLGVSIIYSKTEIVSEAPIIIPTMTFISPKLFITASVSIAEGSILHANRHSILSPNVTRFVARMCPSCLVCCRIILTMKASKDTNDCHWWAHLRSMTNGHVFRRTIYRTITPTSENLVRQH